MGQPQNKELIILASALISVGALSSCDAGESSNDKLQPQYSTKNTGRIMPEPEKSGREQCYGVALAQQNDCATRELSDCAGTASEDYLPEKWKYVSPGECEILGGSLVEPPKKRESLK